MHRPCLLSQPVAFSGPAASAPQTVHSGLCPQRCCLWLPCLACVLLLVLVVMLTMGQQHVRQQVTHQQRHPLLSDQRLVRLRLTAVVLLKGRLQCSQLLLLLLLLLLVLPVLAVAVLQQQLVVVHVCPGPEQELPAQMAQRQQLQLATAVGWSAAAADQQHCCHLRCCCLHCC